MKCLTKPNSPPKSLTFLTLTPSMMLDISKREDNTSMLIVILSSWEKVNIKKINTIIY